MNERMSAEDRRDQIIKIADTLISELGYLPLPIGELSQRAGISRALIYARFASQHDLVNTVLQVHFNALENNGLFKATADLQSWDDVHEVASIYLTHVAEAGPALHVGFREPFMKGRIDPRLRAQRDRAFRAIARITRKHLRFGVGDTIAAVQMLLTIPEEVGRIIFEKELALEEGLQLSRRLLNSSIEALSPSA